MGKWRPNSSLSSHPCQPPASANLQLLKPPMLSRTPTWLNEKALFLPACERGIHLLIPGMGPGEPGVSAGTVPSLPNLYVSARGERLPGHWLWSFPPPAGPGWSLPLWASVPHLSGP